MRYWLALLTAAWGAAPLMAAPITFNTALPVGKSAFINREQVVIRSFDNDGTEAGRDLDVSALISVLGYGVTPKFALFAALPYLDKDLRVTAGGERVTRSSTGLGDLRAFGRYTLYQDDAKNRTFRVAGFAGVKAPTGDDDDIDALGRLPIPLQSGTGSWDEFAGVVATYQTLPYQIDAQLAYTATGSAHGFEGGDQLRADVSLQYRIRPRQVGADTTGFLYGVLEANVIDAQRNLVLGVADPNSGGTSVYLSPGIQYVSRRFILEAAVQLPISQDLNGDALDTDYVLTFGYRANF